MPSSVKLRGRRFGIPPGELGTTSEPAKEHEEATRPGTHDVHQRPRPAYLLLQERGVAREPLEAEVELVVRVDGMHRREMVGERVLVPELRVDGLRLRFRPPRVRVVVHPVRTGLALRQAQEQRAAEQEQKGL